MNLVGQCLRALLLLVGLMTTAVEVSFWRGRLVLRNLEIADWVLKLVARHLPLCVAHLSIEAFTLELPWLWRLLAQSMTVRVDGVRLVVCKGEGSRQAAPSSAPARRARRPKPPGKPKGER